MKKILCIIASSIFLTSGMPGAFASTVAKESNPQQSTGDADNDIVHILNRITFGPRPGDIEHVRQVGIQRYIEEQLNPGALNDPVETDPRYNALKQDPLEIIQEFQNVRKQVQEFKKKEKGGDNQNQNADDPQKQAAKQMQKEFYRNTEGMYKNAKLERALMSQRQLQEVMVDFWYNHFNVYTGKGLDRALCGPYEEQAIRPFVLGKFRDILGATCHHPAMLFYLDNWQNTSAQEPNNRNPNNKNKGKASGLNENYARELMELHTLGVDGGYTQKDVTELAHVLTGLGLGGRYNRNQNVEPVGPYGAVFNERKHDFGEKVVIGHRINGQGEREIEDALDLLARQPATAHHISYQLAQYFVADNPPPQLVNKLAQKFQQTNGDIRIVMQTLLSSPEFWDPKNEHTKYKSPFRYVMSALRATAAQPNKPDTILGFLTQQGQPIYGCLTPDGYKNTQDAWMNPDALLRRINFATGLGAGQLPGITIDPPEYRTLGATISGGKFSPQTVGTIAKQPEQIRSALLLGSPEFMRY
jgi:uncharacterized protein (DUF1800 family)